MKLIPFLLMTLLAVSCAEAPSCSICATCTDYVKINEQTALVESKNGLQVFVMAEPKRAYITLETLSNDLLSDVIEQSKGKKKFGQLLKGIVEASSNYVSLNQVVTNMCNEAQKRQPNADGVIFINNLSQAKVIQFSTVN